MIKKTGVRGRRLFAAFWRCILKACSKDGRDIFTECFGERRSFPWRPLSNAVYWEEKKHRDADYILDECRSYSCRGGTWREERYENLYFDRKRFHSIIRGADQVLRRRLKTGHYLREESGDGAVSPYVDCVLEAERRAELEATRPKIEIDLSGLDQIRRDAMVTRESLLAVEEMEDSEIAREKMKIPEEPVLAQTPPEAGRAEPLALDETQRKILMEIIRGEPVDKYIRVNRLMPTVVADSINEALFEEIGDNVLECDGNTISLVEDYREDVLRLLGGGEQ